MAIHNVQLIAKVDGRYVDTPPAGPRGPTGPIGPTGPQGDPHWIPMVLETDLNTFESGSTIPGIVEDTPLQFTPELNKMYVVEVTYLYRGDDSNSFPLDPIVKLPTGSISGGLFRYSANPNTYYAWANAPYMNDDLSYQTLTVLPTYIATANVCFRLTSAPDSDFIVSFQAKYQTYAATLLSGSYLKYRSVDV